MNVSERIFSIMAGRYPTLGKSLKSINCCSEFRLIELCIKLYVYIFYWPKEKCVRWNGMSGAWCLGVDWYFCLAFNVTFVSSNCNNISFHSTMRLHQWAELSDLIRSHYMPMDMAKAIELNTGYTVSICFQRWKGFSIIKHYCRRDEKYTSK